MCVVGGREGSGYGCFLCIVLERVTVDKDGSYSLNAYNITVSHDNVTMFLRITITNNDDIAWHYKVELHLKPPKFEHIFVAVITFFPYLLCKYFLYQLVAYCVCFKMICKKSL